MSKVILNGKEIEFSEGENIRTLLRSRKSGMKNLIIEFNGNILTEKDPLENFTLKDGDSINLYSMVGGG